LVAISLWLAREWRDISIVLIVGSIALLMSYLLGARVGTEDAADPSLVAGILFGGAVLLIPVGLLVIGVKQLGGSPSDDRGLSHSPS